MLAFGRLSSSDRFERSCWNKISFRSQPGYRCMATLPHEQAIRENGLLQSACL
jgi:hypothetical protein